MESKKLPSLFSLTWPIFIELGLQVLVGNVDQMMISRYSENSVSAIGNSNQLINLLILLFSIISLAATILISQYRGAGRPDKVNETCTLSIFFNLAVSLAVSALVLLFCEPIFRWMGVPDSILGETCQYTGIIVSCLFSQAVILTLSAILKSSAMMRETLIAAVVINVLNIGGNALFLHGVGPIPPMGVAGVALSSNLSKLVGMGVMIYFFHRRSGVVLSLRHLRPFPWGQLKRLLRIGLPSGGESLSYNFSQLCIQKCANLFGLISMNTKVYASMFAYVSYLYGSAISQASQILVGYLIGGGNLEEAQKKIRVALLSSIAVSLCVSVTFYLCSDLLFGFFTSDPEVLRLGKSILLVEIFLEAGRAVNMVMVRCLQAAGDIIVPVATGVVSMWAVAVGLSYLLGACFNWGLVGVWVAMACDEIGRAVVFLLRYKSGAWKSKRLLSD